MSLIIYNKTIKLQYIVFEMARISLTFFLVRAMFNQIGVNHLDFSFTRDIKAQFALMSLENSITF